MFLKNFLLLIVISGLPEAIVQCSDRCLCFCKLIDDLGFTTSSFTKKFFPENKLINIPNFLKNDDVASILLQGMTVEYLFERLYKIQKNEFILFHAAAGGVGLVASQWAKSIGCKMIGTVVFNTVLCCILIINKC